MLACRGTLENWSNPEPLSGRLTLRRHLGCRGDQVIGCLVLIAPGAFVMIRIGDHAAFACAVLPLSEVVRAPDLYVSRCGQSFLLPASSQIAPQFSAHPAIALAVDHPISRPLPLRYGPLGRDLPGDL